MEVFISNIGGIDTWWRFALSECYYIIVLNKFGNDEQKIIKPDEAIVLHNCLKYIR